MKRGPRFPVATAVAVATLVALAPPLPAKMECADRALDLARLAGHDVAEKQGEVTVIHGAAHAMAFVKVLDRSGSLLGRKCFSAGLATGDKLPEGSPLLAGLRDVTVRDVVTPKPLDVYVRELAAEVLEQVTAPAAKNRR